MYDNILLQFIIKSMESERQKLLSNQQRDPDKLKSDEKPMNINDSMYESQIEQDPLSSRKQVPYQEIIGEESEDKSSSIDEHKKILAARQIIVEDSSCTKRHMQQVLEQQRQKAIQQRLDMMPKKHRNQLISKSMMNDQNLHQMHQEDMTRKSRLSFSHQQNEDDLQELKYLSELTFWQKFNILIYNCLESFIIAALMFNSMVYTNLSSVLSILIIFFMSFAFTPRKQCNIKYRRNAVFANAVISVLMIVTKILYIVVGKVKYIPGDQSKMAWVETFGVCFDEHKDIDLRSSIQSELISLGISLFYFGFIMNLTRAKFGKVKVKRIQTTISHQKTAGGNRGTLYNQSFMMIQSHRVSQDIKPINERVIFHQYFGEFKDKLFAMLLSLILIDSAIEQSLPQLVQQLVVFMVLYIWIDPMSKSMTSLQKMDHLDRVSSFVQFIVTLQLLSIYCLNFPIVSFMTKDHSRLQWLFGILGLSSNKIEPYQVNKANIHILAICLIIQLSFLYRSSSDCYQYRKLEKKLLHSHLHDNPQILKNLIPQQSENSKKIKPSQTLDIKLSGESEQEDSISLRYILFHFILPRILIWICRVLSIFLAYFYHDWQSILLLLWVTHGTFLSSAKNFSDITRKAYIPLFMVIAMFYFTINIKQLMPEKIWSSGQAWNYGMFQFQNPVSEVILQQMQLIFLFFWVKTQNSVSQQDENLSYQGVKFFRYMSRKESYTFQNVLLLLTPYLEQFLLVIILLAGLEKVDVYHIIFLFLFVNFLVFQDRKELLTRILIFSSSFFILGKYLCSLITSGDSKDVLEIIGLYTPIESSSSQIHFEYPFNIQEWMVLFMGYIYFTLQRFIQSEQDINACVNEAKNNLKRRFPLINKYFQLIYNVKRYLMLILVYMTFFYLIQIYPRSLINWGFLIIINILFYIQLSEGNYSLKEKLRYWLVMIIYSSIVILVNIVFLFCQLPYIKNKPATKQMFDNFPKSYQQMIGLKIMEPHELDNNLVVIFVPYLIFLIASAYIKSEVEKWHHDDEKFKQDIISTVVYQKVVPQVTGVKQDPKTAEAQIKEKENQVRELQTQIGEVKIHFARIRFSPLFVAYSFKSLWPIFNLFASYSNILLNLSILVLTLSWWLNLANCLQILLFVVFLHRTGSKIQTLKTNQRFQTHLKKEGKHYQVYDKDLIEQSKTFQVDLKKLLLEQRLVSWRLQYILVSMVLILIYLSQFIDIFAQIAVEQLDEAFQEKLRTATYYMFVSGIYNEQSYDHQEGKIDIPKGTSGYIIILLLCICEKISLSWIENKFGCDQQAYETIDQFQRTINQLDSQLQKANEKIQEINKNSVLINKRAKMLMLRQNIDISYIAQERDTKLQSMAFSSIPSNISQNQEQTKDLRSIIKNRLLIDSQLSILKGFKVLIENLIISATIISAVIKMNFQSIIYFILIAITINLRSKNSHKGSMRVLLNFISTFLFIRLMLILSNIDLNINPMPYPKEFQEQSNLDEFFIPWINSVKKYINIDDKEFSQWAYFLGFIIVPEKVNSLYIDFWIIFLVYVHYQTCQFWLIPHNFETVISKDTEELLDKYLKETVVSREAEPTDKEVKALIKEIQNQSMKYRFYKFLLRLSNIWYSKMMVSGILLLSILSNTLFSLGLIFIVCVLMFNNNLFLDYTQARKKLIPILRDFILSFLLIEIIINLIYQIPLPIFAENSSLYHHIAKIMGVDKIWEITILGNQFNYRFYKTKKVVQLACKALIYLIVNLQIQIIESKNFIRIKEMIQHGNQQGQAITWRFNNLKIKKYLKYQNINLQKEIMMIRVKENCDKWRKLFEKQAEQQKEYRATTVEFDPKFTRYQSMADPIIEEPDESIKLQHTNSVAEKSADYFQGVNSDYLQFRKLTQRQMELKSQVPQVQDRELVTESIGSLILSPFEQDLKKVFKDKKKRLGILIQLYLYIRKRCVNPILFINDRQKIEHELKNIKGGETKIMSSIENAMLADSKIEMKTGKKSNENLEQQISFQKMGVRYIKLCQQIIQSNLDFLSYFFMILATAQNPGIVTLAYPFSVFGFAAMEETRPRKHFWFFIMLFTQALIVIEFVFSLRFWQDLFKSEFQQIQKINSQYYVGFMVGGDFVQGNETDLWLLLKAFLPKILVLWSTMTFCHNEILLKFFEKKEQDKESMFTAYKRFIHGNFDIMIDENMNINSGQQQLDIREELNRTVFEYMLKISQDDSSLFNSSKKNALNWDEIKRYVDEYRPFKSEQDIFEEYEQQETESRKAKQDLKRIALNLQNQFYRTFVSNSYMQRLYPSLKIQKPGLDFYQIMVSVQVLMCLYILLHYPSMDAEHSSILSQVNRNQFSGHMVVVLATMIFLMIVERYIYKSKNFTQLENKEKVIELQSKGRNLQEIKVSPKNSSKKYMLATDESPNQQSERQQSLNIVQSSKKKQEQDSKSQSIHSESQVDFNISVLARSTITLRTVVKFYFQWLILLLIHIMLFFYLPISGNLKYHQTKYCDLSLYFTEREYLCNDLNKNSSIKIFYLLSCLYFFTSALQVKHGLPEVMTSYFMMNKFHYMYKYVFLIFYYIPFIFELRCFIDWTYTKTSLDVYQWIKLNQIQADLYKAKTNNIWYFSKKTGEKMPLWYKNVVGLSLIALIFCLSLGPMFLFSSFNLFGEINPVSSASISLKVSLQDPDGVLSTYKLFDTNTIQKKQDDISDWEYKSMEFDQNYESRNFDKSQIQYLIMNNFPQENWYIAEKSKDNLIENLEGYLNRTYNETQMKFEASLQYSFTRASPKTALTPQGQQTFDIFSLKTKDYFIQQFVNALKAKCEPEKPEEYQVEINDLFSPVIQLIHTNNIEVILNQEAWKKSIKLKYDPCQHIWNLNQHLAPGSPEDIVYRNSTQTSKQEDSGISLFILSRKTLPSYLNLPLMTFYITIIYALAKLFRSGFVPITASIYINDAPHPDDILMLCETIVLFRLKEKLKEEEELFFLLIDIMRSPQVFKAICGDSIKTSKQKVE